ncbi:uncharacterized protein LOC125501082 [Athalia rosae]|uniref:uncharacterized protein LOC125501082 n=1 Tax=Athalia rosae TaxID=37344 RepID=UPI002033884B|nr:uncharacterized protein LOC125501082 [Athalia rosae]
MNAIEPLRRRRGAIQASITNFTKILEKWVQNPDTRDPDYLHASFESMQQSFDKFNDIQNKIEDLDQTECSKRTEMVEKYNRAVAKSRKLLREHNNHPSSNLATPNQTSRATTPGSANPTISVAIALPKFDGSTENWASFYDIFSSPIDQNDNLTPVRKLQYLRLSLTNRAASAIQCLETTDFNYAVALAILKKKFECERKILRRHWAILHDYPRLQKDTPSALNSLVDTVYQHTQALENLKALVSNWDIPLIHLILSQVSQNSAWQWELTLEDDKMPSYRSLLEFLEKRANCSDFVTHNGAVTNGHKSMAQKPVEFQNKRGRTPQNLPQAQAFATTNTASCPFCNEEHRIYACSRFRTLSIEEKQKAINKAKLCVNCLGKGHAVKGCQSIPCRICEKRHHTFLHKPPGSQEPATEAIPTTSQAQQGNIPPTRA